VPRTIWSCLILLGEPSGNGDGPVIRERLQRPPHALVGHQPGGRLVEQVAVIDTLDPGLDGLAHGAGRVGVHRDVGAPVLGRLDRGTQFGNRVLRHVQGS
jgi:hypothetical protein